MSDASGAVRLDAHWSVLGKHAGRHMGYQVLDGSLPKSRAEQYLWAAAATGVPDKRNPADGLPWRVFLGAVHNDGSPVCAAVRTTWDGSTDGTGAPSYAWRLLLLDWARAGAAGLTWSALDHAEADAQPPEGAPVSLTIRPTQALELATTVDRLGFEWAARVAALLLDRQRVALTASAGAALPDGAERVLILDAVCSLLPYGCRSWLSAATWSGGGEHDITLAFASAARTGQAEVWLGAGSPPEPRGEVARTYLGELLRLSAKQRSTTELVEHLLRATVPLSAHDSREALRILREIDLLDSVVADLRQGRGELAEVQRVLELYPVQGLSEEALRLILSFLAGHASRARGGTAETLLHQYWSPLTPRLLAEAVLLAGATQGSFQQAEDFLSLMDTVETRAPGAFDALFTSLVEGTRDHGWTGNLVYMAEQRFGRWSESADALLLRSREAGRAWLRMFLRDSTRDPARLRRLVTRAVGEPGSGAAGWLRFAAVLVGGGPLEQATPADAAEFLEAADGAWRTVLDMAATERTPEVVALIWPTLRLVSRDREGRSTLLSGLDRLAPAGGVGLEPHLAADVDLLYAVIADEAGGGRAPVSLPSLRRTSDPATREAYAAALIGRVEPDDRLAALAVEALLGEAPDQSSWQVLGRLRAERASATSYVCNSLDRRLTDDHRRWLELDLPADLVTELSHRPHLGWLRAVCDFRGAARKEAPGYEEMGRAIVGGSVGGRFSPQLLDEITDYMLASTSMDAYCLRKAVREAPDGLRRDLYAAISQTEGGTMLRTGLANFSHDEMISHQEAVAALGYPYANPVPAQPPALARDMSAPPPRPPGPPHHRQAGFWQRLRPRRPIWWNGWR
ncbi:hypothetical protein OG223_45230 [Streptomyces sp. NBC_01478]|uniref:hypothetical protein n=1 Tax=Streptomyces sp. NBC_01478 TaxID=2903882 RepID=UPI002E345958|nr:hypothetical protein [Streptomyces sp. NBC_01478]